MAKYRDSHCQFAKLNQHGKCIAPCHHNDDPTVDHDCIGRAGKSLIGEAEVSLGRNLKLED
jgi:hypothetical protein